ncbi:polysaccharide biosynthesis tyrosine autokinase [Gammaproteobacteria bacterium]|nr:polysaccharide biosynthesis tyrosine autokinase [Gammaproteobacteria bacterium]
MANKPNNHTDLTASGYDEFVEDGGIDLHRYWRVINRHKWRILGLVFAVGLFTTVWAFSLQPVYRSTATLLIGGDEAVTESNTTNTQSRFVQGDFLGTQYELLKSRKVAQLVLEQLGPDRAVILASMETDSESGFDWRDWVPQSWLELVDHAHPRIAEFDPDEDLLNWLRHGLVVSLVPKTTMVMVSFDAIDPELAARVANAYTRAYLDYNLKQRLESTNEASRWLEQQLAKSEAHVMKSADTLRQYQEDAGLVDVAGMINIQTLLLKDRSASLTEARLRSSEAEGLYRRAQRLHKEGQMDNIPEVLENGRIQRLRDQEELLVREIRSDSERYQGDYPGLEDPRRDLQALREQINESLKKIIEGFKTDFEIARANEQRLEREVKALEDSLHELGYKQEEVNALEHTVETNRQAYDAFLSQLMDTRTRSDDTVSTIARVLDPAVPVLIAFKPNKRKILITSLILALMGGVGFALMVDKLDTTLKSREDVQEHLGVPVLGELITLKGKSADGAALVPHLHFMSEPTSNFAESVRTIRAGIVLSGLDQTRHSIVVTSSVSREGKSTVALNLALALAQLGKVLLIDTDLRRPTLASLLGVDPQSSGLTDLVAGTVTMAECIHKIPGDLDVLFAGSTLPPDPPKILTSEHFSKLLEEAQATYDTVIMDSTPLELVSDARLLATRATGVVYVIKADATPHQAVRNGLNALIDTGTPLLGVILNQINPNNVHAYSKHKYGYSRYGGYSHYSYGHDPKSANSRIKTRKVG